MYEGVWKLNQKHGDGDEKFANGVVCVGRSDNGKRAKVVKQVTSMTRDIQIIPPTGTVTSREESADFHLHLNTVVINS